MIEATSCGGVVIFRGKILLLYKNYRNRYEGWVLPKGTVEPGEEYKDTAIREVKEETGATATIIQYVGKSQYSFTVPGDTVEKEVTYRMNNIASLQSEVNDLRADNDARYKSITTSVDLNEVKKKAIKELGMSYPKEKQVVYYSIENNNYMDQYSDIPKQ